jgi:hypothetical protein
VDYEAGRHGLGARFSGADFVSLPLDFTATTNLSFGFWLKLDGNQPGPYYAMVLSSDANTYGRGFAINLENNDYQVWLDDRFVNTGIPVTGAGQWRHFCVTYARGSVKLYLDGNEACEIGGYTNAAPFLDSTNMLVGLRNLFFDRGLKGTIDELHIYNRTLAADEVRNLAAGESDLLAHYLFEGNVLDSSLNARHGTPSTTLTYETGVHGKALVLPPLPYVRLPLNLNPYGAMSFSFWLKINGPLANREYGMFFSTDNNTFGRGLGLNAADSRFMIWHDDNFEYAGIPVPDVGVWKHVGMTYEPGRACFYIDGQCVRTNTQHKNKPPYNDATTVTLGIRNLFLDRGANFSIDDLRIYGRTLAAGEMQAVFATGLVATGLVVEGPAVVRSHRTAPYTCAALMDTGQRVDVTAHANFHLEPGAVAGEVWLEGNILHVAEPAADATVRIFATCTLDSGTFTSAVQEVQIKAEGAGCLLAYYPLDGDARDASGNALDGTVHGASVSTDAVAGACFSFNGRNRIALPVNLNDCEEMSYSLWFKIMGTQPGPYYAMLLSADNNTFGRGIAIALTNSHFLFWFDDGFEGTSTPTPTVGEWHHLAATYRPGDNRLYFDGVEVFRDTGHAGRAPFNDSTNLLLGLRNLFFDRGFNGKIDEVKIYRCALSAAAVWEEYAAVAGDKVNQPPVIQVVADRTGGAAPCKITFDFAGSRDPDGWIVRSEVDQDGDGTYEAAVEGTGQIALEYQRPGTYSTVFRVVDNFGAAATLRDVHCEYPGRRRGLSSKRSPPAGWRP